ncbi:Hypothetical_protein [Hexamita inflata]|uniref:Hypothetical_protein n=1 Tax=Hexamita inflata TaxID=28002 RepID=A0AA86TXV2_9EUKA|nr:Hypothetical protein HINF_LOCUS18752 [Hexamita inflata]
MQYFETHFDLILLTRLYAIIQQYCYAVNIYLTLYLEQQSRLRLPFQQQIELFLQFLQQVDLLQQNILLQLQQPAGSLQANRLLQSNIKLNLMIGSGEASQ